jgi:hypothetical protein
MAAATADGTAPGSPSLQHSTAQHGTAGLGNRQQENVPQQHLTASAAAAGDAGLAAKQLTCWHIQLQAALPPQL